MTSCEALCLQHILGHTRPLGCSSNAVPQKAFGACLKAFLVWLGILVVYGNRHVVPMVLSESQAFTPEERHEIIAFKLLVILEEGLLMCFRPVASDVCKTTVQAPSPLIGRTCVLVLFCPLYTCQVPDPCYASSECNACLDSWALFCSEVDLRHCWFPCFRLIFVSALSM
jgi:hypothetical protein